MIPFASYHAYLICRNRTTLESMEGGGRVRIAAPSRSSSSRPREDVSDRLRRLAGGSAVGGPSDDEWKRDEQLTREERKALKKANKLNIYNVGIKENWRIVMGNDYRLWMLPIGEPDGDGYSHHINTDILQQLEVATANIRGGGVQKKSTSTSNAQGSVNASPISSIRGKNRMPRPPVDHQMSPTKSLSRKTPGYSNTGHGLVEWGAPPKKDFVMYGINNDDMDSGGVLGGEDNHQPSTEATVQMDSDVWS